MFCCDVFLVYIHFTMYRIMAVFYVVLDTLVGQIKSFYHTVTSHCRFIVSQMRETWLNLAECNQMY